MDNGTTSAVPINTGIVSHMNILKLYYVITPLSDNFFAISTIL